MKRFSEIHIPSRIVVSFFASWDELDFWLLIRTSGQHIINPILGSQTFAGGEDKQFIDFPTCSDRTSGDFQFWFHLSVTHGFSKTWKIMWGSSLMVGFTGYSSADFQICHVHPLKIVGKKNAWKKHQFHTGGSIWYIYIFLAARWWFYDWLLNALASLQRVFPPSEVRPTNQHEALQGEGGSQVKVAKVWKRWEIPSCKLT